MAKVLVVDDEPSLLSTIGYSLRKEGHEVLTAADGERAVAVARRELPDLIVLDLMLPKLDGLEVCRMLRQSTSPGLRSVPILMLTAKADEVDKVVGLEIGADDYVTKPFSMRELMARTKAMLRRAVMEVGSGQSPAEKRLALGPIAIDPDQRRVTRDGRDVNLKPKEFELLRFLVSSPGHVYSREQLLDHVWGVGYAGEQRTVDVHVRWLREKIEQDPGHPQLIETVRGVGYRAALPRPGARTRDAEVQEEAT